MPAAQAIAVCSFFMIVSSFQEKPPIDDAGECRGHCEGRKGTTLAPAPPWGGASSARPEVAPPARHIGARRRSCEIFEKTGSFGP